jgi:hypothetical protein
LNPELQRKHDCSTEDLVPFSLVVPLLWFMLSLIVVERLVPRSSFIIAKKFRVLIFKYGSRYRLTGSFVHFRYGPNFIFLKTVPVPVQQISKNRTKYGKK